MLAAFGERRRRGRGRRLPVRIQLVEHLRRRVEALGQAFVEALVAELLHLRLVFRLLGDLLVLRLAPVLGDAHDPRGGNVVPLGERLLRGGVELAGNLQPMRFLEALETVLGRDAHLPVDHARTEALTVEHDLRLHDRPLL